MYREFDYSQYNFKSNTVRKRFINGEMNLEEYASYIKELIEQETSSRGYLSGKEEIVSTLYKHEINQQSSAIQEINRIKQNKIEEERRIHKEEEERRIRKEEEEENRTITPEQKLHLAREQYYQKEIPALIDEYKRDANKHRSTHNKIQWMVILGSAITTSFTSITIFSNLPIISTSLKIAAAVSSLLVTIAASLTAYFKYRERSINAQKAADDIQYEYDAIKLGTHSYLDETREKAMGVFADRVMRRVKEQREQQQLLEQPPEGKQLQSRT